MGEKRILHLNLHREFFGRIAEGTKREEYRDRTDYWKRRLYGRDYDVIRFRNGYVRLLRCMTSKTKRREERDRVVRYFMGLDAKNEKIPQVSVDATCRRRAADEGEAAYRACMANQQSAYDFLKPLWPHLPRKVALNCRWMLFEYADGSKQMNPDYSIVRSCMEIEMRKAMQEASREGRMKALPNEELKY